MRITSSGNVGIGSTAPTTALDVNGTVRATSFISTSGSSNFSAQGINNVSSLSIGTTATGADLSFGSGSDRSISVLPSTSTGNSLTVQAGGTSATTGNINGGNLVLSSGAAYGTGTSQIQFNTASGGAAATSMMIAGSGNVGIGTTVPAAKLDVAGTGMFTGQLYVSNNRAAGGSGATGTITLGDATISKTIGSAFQFGSGGTFSQTIATSAGNIGIGTLNPTANLAFGGSSARTISVDRHTTANTAGNILTVQAGGATSAATDKSGGSLVLASGIATGTGSSDIQFQTATAAASTGTADNAPSTKMTILGNGNVGIGTTDPIAKLHILDNRSGSVPQIHLRNVSGTSFIRLEAANGVVKTTYGSDGVGGFFWTETSHPLRIGNAGGERLRIDTVGNVGIGSTSPRAGLDVSNGALVTKAATLNATTTIDFATGNLQFTNASCQAFTLNNLKDGGSYVFAVKGATAATCSFTLYSDAGSGALTAHMPPDHGATVASKHTLYNLLVVGSDVYISWSAGL